jgi:hypothetical protein
MPECGTSGGENDVRCERDEFRDDSVRNAWFAAVHESKIGTISSFMALQPSVGYETLFWSPRCVHSFSRYGRASTRPLCLCGWKCSWAPAITCTRATAFSSALRASGIVLGAGPARLADPFPGRADDDVADRHAREQPDNDAPSISGPV